MSVRGKEFDIREMAAAAKAARTEAARVRGEEFDIRQMAVRAKAMAPPRPIRGREFDIRRMAYEARVGWKPKVQTIPYGLRVRRREDYPEEPRRYPARLERTLRQKADYPGRVALVSHVYGMAPARKKYLETLKKSIAFYKKLGFPEFAGKYAAFKVPEEMKVAKITPTPKGLDVLFEEKVKAPPSIAERVFKWRPPTLDLKGWILPKKPGAEVMRKVAAPKREAHKVLAGFIAPFEAFPYSISHLLGKKEWFGVKVPHPPPTVVGGLIGKGVERGAKFFGKELPSRELEETWEKGAEYTLGTIFGDIAFGYLVGKGAEKAIRRIRGVKAVKIKGVEEAERIGIEKWALKGERVTKLALKKQRVPYKYANWLKRMERYFQPKQLYLAGKEKLAVKAGKEVFIGGRAVTTARPAAPYVAAVKYTVTKKPSIFTRILQRLHIKKAAPPTIYKKSAALTTKLGWVKEPVKAVSLKQFTGVQIFGKIDPSVYLRYAKAVPAKMAQSWYRQMGGVTLKQLPRLTTKTITAATKIAAVEIPKTGFAKIFAFAPAVTRAVPTTEKITRRLVKPIELPKLTLDFVGRKPKKPIVKPKAPPFKFEPVLKPRRIHVRERIIERKPSVILEPPSKFVPKPILKEPLKRRAVKPIRWFGIEEWKAPRLPSLVKQPFHIEVELPTISADIADYTKELPKIKPIVSPIVKPYVGPKVSPRQFIKTTTKAITKAPLRPPITTYKAPPPFMAPPFLPRGGMSQFARRLKGKYAAWYKRRHPIPTEKEVAERFGLIRRRKRKKGKKRKKR